MKRSMLRLALLVAATVASGAIASTTAAADGRTIHGELVLKDVTFPDPYMTEQCGFKVRITVNAHSPATAQLNGDGRVIHEEDIWLGTIRYSSPASGKSTSRTLNATVSTDYPGGASIGSPAVSNGQGAEVGEVTVGQPGTGTVKIQAVVDGFDEASGIPFTHLTSIVSLQGEFDRMTANICKALQHP